MPAMELVMRVPGASASASSIRQVATALNAAAQAQERLNRAEAAGRRQAGGAGVVASALQAANGGGATSGGQATGGGGGLAQVAGALAARYGGRALAAGAARLGIGAAARGAIAAGATAAAGGTAASGPAAPVVAAALLGLAVVVGQAAAATHAFVEAAKTAAEDLASYGAAKTISGAGRGEVARLVAMGMSPSAIPGAAASLRQRLSSDPLAQLTGAQIGLGVTTPRQFGGQNEAHLLIKALNQLEAVGKKAGPAEQLRAARNLGLEDLLPMLNVSDATKAARQRDTQRGTAIMEDPKAIQAANDFNAALGRIGLNFQFLTTALGKGAMGPITSGLNAVADAIGGFAEVLNRNPWVGELMGKIAEGFLKFIAGAITMATQLVELIEKYPVLKAAVEKAVSLLPGTSGGNANPVNTLSSALNNNTNAINSNTALLKAQVYGGGMRAKGAIPAGLTGMQLNQMLMNSAHRLGYWTL